MYLSEFNARSTALRTKLTSVVSQLRSRRDDQGTDKPMTRRALIGLLKDHDIPVTSDQLFDMIKEPPLKNIIDNIEGNRVIFRGEPGAKEPQSSDTEDDLGQTLDRMARKAAGL